MKEAGLKLGDYLEFELKDGGIRLYPRKIVDSCFEVPVSEGMENFADPH
jgi:hypothetical protein